MRLLGLFVGSWALGVLLWWIVGSIASGRPMGSGDLGAAALYSGLMFALTAPVVYAPAMWLVSRTATTGQAVLIMTGAAVIQSVGAATLVLAAFGGFRREALLKPEAFLFLLIFGTAGAALGAGYLIWLRPRAT